MWMRHSPSTSTRAVPSGNFTILVSRATQPTGWSSSGLGSSVFAFFWRTVPSNRSPVTKSSTSLRLALFSTSKGTTAPGKMTTSERPRMGRVSGSEREEMREGSSDFSPGFRMLINSVSDDSTMALVKFRAYQRLKRFKIIMNYVKNQAPSKMGTLVVVTCGWLAAGTSMRRNPFR